MRVDGQTPPVSSLLLPARSRVRPAGRSGARRARAGLGRRADGSGHASSLFLAAAALTGDAPPVRGTRKDTGALTDPVPEVLGPAACPAPVVAALRVRPAVRGGR
ncbi:hypothetical protein ABZ079_27120 [Streptomyces sp. NPDC006314]|uniref:hypothetical protein n=1 Tax=Streptomyces sp. NPDC006314 TaxID=3154475 RepID=UPI0033BE3775